MIVSLARRKIRSLGQNWSRLLTSHPSCNASAHLSQMCENGTSCNILNRGSGTASDGAFAHPGRPVGIFEVRGDRGDE